MEGEYSKFWREMCPYYFQFFMSIYCCPPYAWRRPKHILYLENAVIGLNGYENAESIMKRWDSDSSLLPSLSLGFSSWTTSKISTRSNYPLSRCTYTYFILHLDMFILPYASVFSHTPPNSQWQHPLAKYMATFFGLKSKIMFASWKVLKKRKKILK